MDNLVYINEKLNELFPGDVLKDYMSGVLDSSFYLKSNDLYIDFQNPVYDKILAARSKQNRYNYVNFKDIDEFNRWFTMVSKPRKIDLSEDLQKSLKRSDITFYHINKITQIFNWEDIYQPELDWWYAATPQQILSLLLNREYYQGKGFYNGERWDNIRDKTIVSGIRIAGKVTGNGMFDARLLDDIIKRYDIKSMYDPCAGWGHRMITAIFNKIDYLGNDINLYSNQKMLNYFKDNGFVNSNIRLLQNDSATQYEASKNKHELVFTSPPYWHKIEKYKGNSADKLSEEEFLIWWKNTINCSIGPKTKYFGYQVCTNKRCDEFMNKQFDERFTLIETIDCTNPQVSHMNRLGRKDNNEETKITKKSKLLIYLYKVL